MYRCSECGLLIGPEDATECDEPSRPCHACHVPTLRELREYDRTHELDDYPEDDE